MGSTLKIGVYLSIWTIFIANQLLQRYWGIVIPYVHSYLDDLLLFPVLMPILLFIYRTITPNRVFNWFYILSIYVYVSITAEVLYPFVFTQYTFDYFDFVAYAFGMVFFVLFFNKD